MTFNTTSLPLLTVLKAKRLLLREPLRPLQSGEKRHLLVTPQIDALLDGHILFGVFPDREAEVLIGKFSARYLVRVSRKKGNSRPDVEQIVGSDEVWAICPRKPKPGWRILGRWYAKDVFVALRPWPKEELFRNYDHAAQEVIDDWKELFGHREPHRGRDVGDYMSEVYIDVDV